MPMPERDAASDHTCEPDCPVCANRAEMKRLAEEMLPAYVDNDPPAAKVLVCGSRMFALDGDGKRIVRDRLDALYEAADSPDFHLVTGGANGPDEWAREWAVQGGVDHTVLYAQWEDYGKRAGIIRNIAMLNTNPGLVVAFWDGESKGTKHTMDEAEKRGIPIEVIRG